MFRQLSSRLITRVCARTAVQLETNTKYTKFPLIRNSGELLLIRNRHVTSGIQGRRNSKTPIKRLSEIDEEEFEADDKDSEEFSLKDSVYEAIASEALGNRKSIRSEENVLIIQPHIKWGPNQTNVSADIKLQEAEDLIRSLDTWNISGSIKVPLVNFRKNTLFGKGKLDELRREVVRFNGDRINKISCVFVSVSQLNQIQKSNLEFIFGVPVLDRFSIVIQILNAHASSREAKLQIALAELPYIWHHLGADNSALLRSKLTDSQKMMLRNRERRIKNELEQISLHRKMVRNRRSNKELPVIAVVGYTNCGKTSLIKALTNQEKLEPKNKLFATLDVTAHMGRLPCNLQVIYIDTIGFMSDIPTNLIQCFITTLEDAMVADLIIHVQDVAHINVFDQREHVEQTLRNLVYNSESEKSHLLKNILNVGNKCDLIGDVSQTKEYFEGWENENETAEPMHFISCAKGTGMDDLIDAIERNILKVTNRMKMIIRVPQGGEELSWLYKNTAVTHTEICTKSNEYLKVHVLLTELALTQFKNTFLKKTSR